MSEHLNFLMQRSSIKAREMSGPGPDDDTLAKILRAGLRVPDHGRLFPWRFVILKDSALVQLGDIAAQEFATREPNAPEKLIDIERARFRRAPVIVAVISRIITHPKVPEWEQVLSAGASCQNILNAAFALGVAAQWLTEWPAYNGTIMRKLGLSGNERIAGFIYLGNGRPPTEERPRAQLDDVVSIRTSLDV